jgi:predicted RNA binding protein with dsRBD fold (UPF0201 family)
VSSTYSRKSDRKLIFTQDILDEARRRIENGVKSKKSGCFIGNQRIHVEK